VKERTRGCKRHTRKYLTPKEAGIEREIY